MDAGVPGHGRVILDSMSQVGLDPGNIRRIAITHADYDHAGGLGELCHQLKVPFFCHEMEQDLVRRPKERIFSNTRGGALTNRMLQFMMRIERKPFLGMEPDILVRDGDTVGDLEVVHTPGHTPGHIALWQADACILFSGDACLVRKGRIWEPAGLFTPDLPGARQSIYRLARRFGKSLQTLASGHSEPVRANAGRYLRIYLQELYI